MARAISRILSVPWSARRTCLTRMNATTRASTQTSMMANRARVSPEPNSTLALASCASSRTGLISPPRRPSGGALDQARSPGRGPGRFERKACERGPRPGVVPGVRPWNRPSREPARIGRIIATGRRTGQPRESAADASGQGRWQGFRGVQAKPAGVAAQPEAGPVAAVGEGGSLEIVDQRADQGQAELAVVDLAVGGAAGRRGGRRGPVADLDPEAVGRLDQVDLDRVGPPGPVQVADRDRAGLGDGYLEVLDPLLAHP